MDDFPAEKEPLDFSRTTRLDLSSRWGNFFVFHFAVDIFRFSSRNCLLSLIAFLMRFSSPESLASGSAVYSTVSHPYLSDKQICLLRSKRNFSPSKSRLLLSSSSLVFLASLIFSKTFWFTLYWFLLPSKLNSGSASLNFSGFDRFAAFSSFFIFFSFLSVLFLLIKQIPRLTWGFIFRWGCCGSPLAFTSRLTTFMP